MNRCTCAAADAMRGGATLALVAALLASGATAQTTDSAAVLAHSADLDCLDYRVVGGCLWLHCEGAPPSCSTRTSVKYRHYIPDAVVTAYGAAGRSPWTELRALVAMVPGADGGTAAKGSLARGSTGLRFKHAEVFGSPGIAWVEGLRLGTTVCAAGPRPLEPFFVSATDPMWRADALQAPLTLANVLRKVPRSGALGPTWGPVYPRSGFVQQAHDYKAAAVVAQRAADLVTRHRQPHVYRPLLFGDRDGQWRPGAVREGRAGSHRWQPLVPRTKSCAVFEESVAAVGPADPLGDMVSAGGGYAWNLWRPYECCRERGQRLLDHW